MGVSWVEYLNMVEKQESEAKQNMEDAERKYREAKVKHATIVRQKESFLESFDKLGG